MKRVRVLLLTHYYEPEVGAPQTRLRATATGLQERGFAVTVAAPVPHYPSGHVPAGYSFWRPQREKRHGVPVVRLPALPIAGGGTLARLADYGAYMLMATSLAAIVRRHDVVLVESPPLTMAVPARLLKALGVPYVLHVADPWPDFPVELGYLSNPASRRAAYALERWAYHHAAAITTVSPPLADMLSSKPGAEGKVSVVWNGVDIARFAGSPAREAAREALGWGLDFTVLYVGTIGMAQGIRTLVDGAAIAGPGVQVRIVGDGVESAALRAYAAAIGAANVHFDSPVAADRVPLLLAGADAAVVLLRKSPLSRVSLPTKLLEAMAARLPVVLSAEGLTAQIVAAAECGLISAPEDPPALSVALRATLAEQDRQGVGDRGHAYAAAHFDRARSIDTLAGILLRAVSG